VAAAWGNLIPQGQPYRSAQPCRGGRRHGPVTRDDRAGADRGNAGRSSASSWTGLRRRLMT